MKFQALLLTLAGSATLMLSAGAASAASPAYCALYAREYAIDTVQPSAAAGMLQSVQDQAYYRCLNQDEDPALPQASAYSGPDKVQGAAIAPVGVASAPIVASMPPLPKPKPAPAPPPKTVVIASVSKSTAPYHGSGLTPWTPQWMTWCAQNFPNSWDAKTGTILHYDSDTRELCK